MDTDDLQQQFQELQAQQQKKLMERRRKKEEANKNKSRTTSANQDPSGKFGVNDNLDLKLADPPSKGMGYLSEELVDHLNNEIREMKDENGRLYKLLSERDFEIRQLKKKSEESKNCALDGPVTNETAATKIIELSKKVRELTAERESEKTKCRQFQKKCYDLQAQLDSKPPPSEVPSVMGSMISLRSAVSDSRSIGGGGGGGGDDPAVDVKALQDRLKQSEFRATDFRNQCQSLRQELKVAHKVLSQELGESVNIPSLLNETSNWRGRAQQIIALQQKVDELKVQLESQGSEMNGPSSLTEKTPSGRRRQEEKYREELKRLERERRESQENMTTRLKTLEEENKSLKDKTDAGKVRNKVLSNEIKSQKAQVQTLLKKSRNDDEFIDALMKQQGQLKKLLEDASSHHGQQNMAAQMQLQQLSMKSQQDANLVDQLQAIAAQKEAQVRMLEMELQHLRQAAVTHAQNNPGSARPVFANSREATTVLDGGSVIEVTATLDSRPTTSQSDADTLTARTMTVPQSDRSTALPASRTSSRNTSAMGGNTNNVGQVNQQELAELRYRCQELEVMSRAIEVEKDKMAELVGVLQNRLAAETQRLSEAQSELQNHKRQAVEFEKRMARQSLDSGVRRKGGAKVIPPPELDITEDEEALTEKNELMTKLEIQKDENTSLKAALQRTLLAKEEDLRVYGNTLEQTKLVFLQALKQMKDKMAS